MAFSIDLDRVRTRANELRTENEEAVAIIVNYKNDLLNLADAWQMDTRTVFQELNVEWDKNIKNMNDGMDQACDVLLSNAVNYEDTDEHVAGELRLKALF